MSWGKCFALTGLGMMAGGASAIVTVAVYGFITAVWPEMNMPVRVLTCGLGALVGGFLMILLVDFLGALKDE